MRVETRAYKDEDLPEIVDFYENLGYVAEDRVSMGRRPEEELR